MIGNDFLKTSPSMYSKTERWQRFEEYADFAVMEVTFNDQQQARTVTNNYADDKTNQFKYKKQSFLAHPEAIKEDDYSIVGFPAIDKNAYVSTIAVNKPNNVSEEAKKVGGDLGKSPFYNSFKDRQGMFDAAIGLSFFAYTYRITHNGSHAPTDDDFFLSWGLMYPTDYGSITAGSSGSMMADSEGYTWGIHFAIDPDASMGLTQALYCEGFDYQGTFGKYNLEGYDLIDGGFVNQRKSYRDGMIQLYGDQKDFKTNLYPNGVNR